MKTRILSLCIVFLLLTVSLAFARTWKAGTFSVEGEYAGMTDDGTKVRIKKTSDGKHVKIALANLSKEDQDFVKSQSKRSGIENPFEDDEDEENADKTATPLMNIPNENKYAFIVGVDVYADESISNLECCVSDAKELTKKLEQIGFPEKNITLLVGSDTATAKQQPTKENIETKLKQLTSNLPENSLIVFYFAGHGTELKDKGACFAPTDVDRSHLDSTVVSVRDVSNYLENSRAQIKLLFADASREVLTHSVHSQETNNVEVPKGLAVLQSCSYGEHGYENRATNHGYFTLTLLEALDGKADTNNDGVVTLNEIFTYTSKQTEVRVKSYEHGATQRPSYSFNGAIQDFPLVTGL